MRQNNYTQIGKTSDLLVSCKGNNLQAAEGIRYGYIQASVVKYNQETDKTHPVKGVGSERSASI